MRRRHRHRVHSFHPCCGSHPTDRHEHDANGVESNFDGRCCGYGYQHEHQHLGV
jgi:hypothetical protein